MQLVRPLSERQQAIAAGEGHPVGENVALIPPSPAGGATVLKSSNQTFCQ
jgi:hypothetical protein